MGGKRVLKHPHILPLDLSILLSLLSGQFPPSQGLFDQYQTGMSDRSIPAPWPSPAPVWGGSSP